MEQDQNEDQTPDTLPNGPEEVFPEFTNHEEVNSTLLSMPRLIGLTVDKMLFARREANIASRKLREREAKLYQDYKTGKDRRWTKEEILILYPSDTVWLDLKRELDLATAKAEYYENRLKMLKETGWLLRTYVDHQLYLSGEGKTPRFVNRG